MMGEMASGGEDDAMLKNVSTLVPPLTFTVSASMFTAPRKFVFTQ
jgi:hypothetical protein